MLEKIKEKEILFMQSWNNPTALLECFFHNFDNLGSFHKEKRGKLRLYQKPFINRESLIDFDKTAEMHKLDDKEKFQLRINAGTIYNLGARKYGKCEYEENFCSLVNGNRIKFKDLVDTKQEVWSLNENTLKLEKSLAYFYNNGKKTCYKLTTETGKEIIVTGNHPFLTAVGWKQINELKTGEFIATPREIPNIANKYEDENIAKLLGYLIGDGGTSQDSVGFTNTNENILQEYFYLMNYFNCNLRKDDITYWAKKKLDYKLEGKIKSSPNKIQEIVRKFKINDLAKNKKIPEEVFRWNKNNIKLLLNRLFACDGHVNLHNYTVEITLASKKLIYQINHLLLRFGIHSFIHYKKSKFKNQYFDAWRLTIAQDFDKFLDVIGIFTKDTGIRRNKKYSTSDRIPNSFIMNLYSSFKDKKKYKLGNLKLYNPSRKKCQRISTLIKNKDLEKLAYSDVRWERIKSINFVGTLSTVAVHVPKNCNYISNEIISHNTCCTLKLDITLSPIYDPGLWCALYSLDEKRLRGVLDSVKLAYDFHPVCKNWDVKGSYKPEIKFVCLCNHWILQGVNTTPKAKDPGNQFYQLHVKKLWGEEVSFETETIYKKRKEAVSEDGVIIRLAGMTDFTRHSPIGEVFFDKENKKWITNYPQYVSPKWDKKEKADRIKAYGGVGNPDYLVYVEGEVIEDSYSVFDMDRVRGCYTKEELQRFEIKKDQVSYFRDLIVLERPKNVDRIFIAQDVGDGSQSEILILGQIGDKYKWLYSITLFGLIGDEQEEILNWIIGKVEANVVAVDCGEALGRLFCDHLEKNYDKSNVVRYAGARKVKTSFEVDNSGKTVIKNGEPVYKEEFMSEWSVARLMTLLYGEKLVLPEDYKFDKQFTKVISGKFGDRRKYTCLVENKDDHVWAAWRVFAIAEWLKNNINKTKPMKKEWSSGTSSWTKNKKDGSN